MRWSVVASLLVIVLSWGWVGCGGGAAQTSTVDDGGAGAGGTGGAGGQAGSAGSMGVGAAGKFGDGGVLRDASQPEAGTCVPAIPSNWSPTWKPPRTPTLNACTKAQIDRRFAICDDVATYDAAQCNAFKRDPANAVCQACLFSTEDEGTWGPIVIKRNGIRDVNVAGCIALVEGNLGASGCGAKQQASFDCPESACFDFCLTYNSFFACGKAAREGICSNYENNDVCADSPAYAICTGYSVFKDYFLAIGRLFCTTGLGDAGILDAGILDASSTTDTGASRDSGSHDACVSIDGGSDAATDEIVVPACGYNPATTSRGYSGDVLMRVSGVLVDNSNVVEDAFYFVDPGDRTISAGACPECLHYSRLSEGNCTCLNFPTCPSYPLSDLLSLDPYPPFNPTHEYSVRLHLGTNPPERLNFGMGDCGCDDNSGTFAISITPLNGVSCLP